MYKGTALMVFERTTFNDIRRKGKLLGIKTAFAKIDSRQESAPLESHARENDFSETKFSET